MSKINLSNNQLQTVNLKKINLTILSYVNLSGNPLICDCSTQHLQRLSEVLQFPVPTCFCPPSLHGVSLLSVDLSSCIEACLETFVWFLNWFYVWNVFRVVVHKSHIKMEMIQNDHVHFNFWILKFYVSGRSLRMMGRNHW